MSKHILYQVRQGKRPPYCPTPLGRLVARLDGFPDAGCWSSTGSLSSEGYGRVNVNGRSIYAHRFMYESAGHTIPDGHVLDHLCRNRACANPAHLEPVTIRTNVLRGSGPMWDLWKQGKCIRGHDLATHGYVRPTGGRTCRACIAHRRQATV